MNFSPKDFVVSKNGTARVKPRKPKPAEAPVAFTPARRVVAFDPSICHLGWAILDLTAKEPARVASGVWSPCKSAVDRWEQYFEFIRSRAMVGTDTAAILEAPNKLGFHREEQFSRKSQITYGRAVGVAHGALLSTGARVYVPDVGGWKGRDSKADTLVMVRLRLKYEPVDDNESDALGLALWFADRCHE